MALIVDDKELRIERLVLSRWEVNSYIVTCPPTRKSVLIDVPPDSSVLANSLKGTDLQYILLTHTHIDHIAGLPAFKSGFSTPLAVHPADQNRLSSPPDRILNDGEVLMLDKISVEVIHTPGHTPGSVCFRIGNYLISGDTIFPGGPGRTDNPADFQQILKSIEEKIFVLPDETKIYPGHGTDTTLKKEKAEYAAFSARPHDAELCGDVVWATG